MPWIVGVTFACAEAKVLKRRAEAYEVLEPARSEIGGIFWGIGSIFSIF